MPFGLPDPTFTTFPAPVRLELDAALKKAIADLPEHRTGAATVTATRTGIEAGGAYQPQPRLIFSGWAARLWGGDWQAGARATVLWGKR